MYVGGPQHSITGGRSPPVYSSGGGGEYPPTLPGSTPMPRTDFGHPGYFWTNIDKLESWIT